MTARPLVVTWYPDCRRSEMLAEQLDGDCELVHYLRFKQPIDAPVKYVLQALKSAWLLVRLRPSHVVVTSPPFVAPLMVGLVASTLRIPWSIDAHTGAFDDRRWQWAARIQAWLNRRAEFVIVTGDRLADVVRSQGGRPAIVANVPTAAPIADASEVTHDQVFCVNTFSPDEPLDELLAAAATLSHLRFLVTGKKDWARAGFEQDVPPNLTFTGWLSDDEYLETLSRSAVVVCLTTRDETFQQGGNEAMAARRPLVTSDMPILRSVFHSGTVHVKNNAASIAAGIADAVQRRDDLAVEIASLAEEADASMARLRQLV